MKISVIIPVYNVEEYIKDCLNSVVCQTYDDDIECILIDDCGSDKSISIITDFVASYQGKVEFKILHHTVNGGLSAARNTGLKEATGEYVYFLDSDDRITPDCLAILASPLQSEKYDFVIGDYKTEGAPFIKVNYVLTSNTKLFGKSIIHSYRNGEWPVMAWNKLCRKDFLISERLFFKEGLIHEDELWSFELASLAKSMIVIRKETYIYRIRNNSITTANTVEKQGRAFNTIFEEMMLFAERRKLLNNVDVHDKIENSRITVFQILYNNKALAKEIYLNQRVHVKNHWRRWFIQNSFNIRKQIRDGHLIFPATIGFYYLMGVLSHYCK